MDWISRANTKYRPEGDHLDAHPLYSTSYCEKEVLELEAHLKKNPDDLPARFTLAGHYLRKGCLGKGPERKESRKNYTNQIQWLVNNRPKHVFHETNSGFSNEFDYQETKSLWDTQLRLNPKDVAVLYHAAKFSSLAEPLYSVLLLKQASQLDPHNELFPDRLCRTYIKLFYEAPETEAANFMKLAIKEFKTAVSLYEDFCLKENQKLYTYRFDLTAHEIATNAICCNLFEDTRAVAQLVLSRTCDLSLPDILTQVKTGEAYGMVSSHNTANSILGQLAVAKGDIPRAVEHLKNLLIAEPFGHIESDLANSLISCGEREAVIEYLGQMHLLFKHRIKSAKTMANQSDSVQFDKQTSRKITKWIREIKSGKNPRMERC